MCTGGWSRRKRGFETHSQSGPPGKGLRNLQTSFHLAQEMGARLGAGEVLFGSVPGVGDGEIG